MCLCSEINHNTTMTTIRPDTKDNSTRLEMLNKLIGDSRLERFNKTNEVPLSEYRNIHI